MNFIVMAFSLREAVKTEDENGHSLPTYFDCAAKALGGHFRNQTRKDHSTLIWSGRNRRR
jgi:hypothetical protein